MAKLSAKELSYLSDLMTMEENACKKARVYARTLTDMELAGTIEMIANNHQKRFDMLLKQLG